MIYDDIPSDVESFDHKWLRRRKWTAGSDLDTICAEDDLSESDLPFSEGAKRIRRYPENNINSDLNANTLYISPNCTNANLVDEAELFLEPCGVPDYVNDIDEKEPNVIFRFFLIWQIIY